jgi:hypothetical protein
MCLNGKPADYGSHSAVIRQQHASQERKLNQGEQSSLHSYPTESQLQTCLSEDACATNSHIHQLTSSLS